MADFAQIELALTNVAQDVDNARQRFDRAKQDITTAQGSMTGLGTTYAEVLTSIADGLAADPTNPAWLNLDARKTLLVALVTTRKAELDAAAAALGI